MTTEKYREGYDRVFSKREGRLQLKRRAKYVGLGTLLLVGAPVVGKAAAVFTTIGGVCAMVDAVLLAGKEGE